jgi:hypothetical protein
MTLVRRKWRILLIFRTPVDRGSENQQYSLLGIPEEEEEEE